MCTFPCTLTLVRCILLNLVECPLLGSLTLPVSIIRPVVLVRPVTNKYNVWDQFNLSCRDCSGI